MTPLSRAALERVSPRRIDDRTLRARSRANPLRGETRLPYLSGGFPFALLPLCVLPFRRRTIEVRQRHETVRDEMDENRTNSGSKLVASSFTAERVIRAFLADTLNFLRGRRNWPEVDGDLSDWVIKMHGVETGNPSEDLAGIDIHEILSSFDSLCTSLGGMRQGSEIRRQIEELAKEEKPRILEAQRSSSKQALETVLSEIVPKMMQVVGIPESFLAKVGVVSYDGVVKLLRASRVFLITTALFHEHPLSLIARALKGDRRATLDLIMVDHMFVNDRCCKQTIRKAALQDDADFMAQVQRALKYKRRVHRREVSHFYLFNLFLFEKLGFALPPINQLWECLDPLGREYDTLQAFEKDFRRRRNNFEHIVKSGALAAKSITANHPNSARPQE